MRQSDKSVRDRYVVEHPPLQVSNEEIGSPDVGKLVVVECDALVVACVRIRESLVSPRLSQISRHRVLLKKTRKI